MLGNGCYREKDDDECEFFVNILGHPNPYGPLCAACKNPELDTVSRHDGQACCHKKREIAVTRQEWEIIKKNKEHEKTCIPIWGSGGFR